MIKIEEDKDLDNALNTINRLYEDNIINPYKKGDKIIDLHTHTTYSDGELSPNELIRFAIYKGIKTIAITDHDTIDGVKKIDRSDPLIIDSGINIIDGIELTAKTKSGSLHILGYGLDLSNQELNKTINEIKTNHLISTLNLLECLKKDYNLTFDYNDIKDMINSNNILKRPVVAKLCIKYKYATTIEEAFDKYITPSYEKTRDNNQELSYEECIELITNSKGTAVLAHPKTLNTDQKELLILIKDMITIGLKGIEVYHSTHTNEETKNYLNIANKLNLLISGGSDYHGPLIKPDIDLGTGKNNNLKIKKLTLLDQLKY